MPNRRLALKGASVWSILLTDQPAFSRFRISAQILRPFEFKRDLLIAENVSNMTDLFLNFA
jgi:hypothetical protein